MLKERVPKCCLGEKEEPTSEERRRKMRSLVGIAPLQPGEDPDAIRSERLSKMDSLSCS